VLTVLMLWRGTDKNCSVDGEAIGMRSHLPGRDGTGRAKIAR
jgi:hypothetical protein